AAATVVARPGTSEHNTGLCADFNMASDTFETTPMYEWMCENAENYGFILRYPKEKQDITGVIYESWHWRFVGINTAKEMNNLGLTLEEYIELKGIDPASDMYGDDSAN
ncbi:MAG: M15 family metallopeptidase, partial [Acutalibacteraceae bacterium]|nr:M15 family metallopeptidase [Acutalibacteraceae bacterium]